MGLRKMTLILLLPLLLVTGSMGDLPKRGSWTESRAVKLAAKLPKPDKGIFWMSPVDVKSESGLSEPGMDVPKALAEGRQAGPNSTKTGNSTETGNSAGRQTDPLIPEGTSGDGCQDATIVIHTYKNDGADIGIVISDLTNALMKNSSTEKCECAEDDVQPVEVDGRLLCINEKKIEDGKECIHTKECKNDKLACIFDAKINGDDGDIEDMRRFCSGSGTLAPPLLILLVSFVASKLHA